MKKIASFSVNHDKLKKGMYVSRIDGDVVTYDLRMKVPNAGDYLSNGALHTFEHLFATYARNLSLIHIYSQRSSPGHIIRRKTLLRTLLALSGRSDEGDVLFQPRDDAPV